MYEELKRQKIKELEGLVEEQETYVSRMGKVGKELGLQAAVTSLCMSAVIRLVALLVCILRTGQARFTATGAGSFHVCL
jgi:hypothetical protein